MSEKEPLLTKHPNDDASKHDNKVSSAQNLSTENTKDESVSHKGTGTTSKQQYHEEPTKGSAPPMRESTLIDVPPLSAENPQFRVITPQRHFSERSVETIANRTFITIITFLFFVFDIILGCFAIYSAYHGKRTLAIVLGSLSGGSMAIYSLLLGMSMILYIILNG